VPDGAVGKRDGRSSTARTVGERLARARARRFVGRTDELDVFRSLVVEPELRCAVLFVHGPGGVGKTALLGRFMELAGQVDVPAVRLDARTLEPSPPAFLTGLAEALVLSEGTPPLEALRAGGRYVLLVDTYEAAAPIDGWLRERFLPQLPSDVLFVIAGRNPPGPEWVADPGWQELLRVLRLCNLGPDDARAYLRLHGIADSVQEGLLQVTHGHPLALALIADVLAQRSARSRPTALFDLADAPDVVRPLVERFVEGVPSGPHREALQVCAHARFTTEDLLAQALGGDAFELFSWLRSLSFLEEGALGLFPHDLARDVLDADLRWRDRARYAELHRRIRAHIVRRAQHSKGAEQQRACIDILFLHRTNPRVRPYLDWSSLGDAFTDILREGDREAILAMVERHEGPQSAAIAARWMERQPQAFAVFRGTGEALIGFTALLDLHGANDEDLAIDPGARAMWHYALRHDPPGPEEEVVAFRFLMDGDAYQGPSASFNLWAARGIQHIVASPHLAWSFAGAFAEPGAVASMFADIDYHRAREADFEVGGRRYGVFAHDFRRVPPAAWLELTGEREIVQELDSPSIPSSSSIVALSESEFADAVRQALRDLHDPDRLARNPLLRARIVRDCAGQRRPTAVLADLIAEAAAALGSHPRDEKLYRALDRTYLRPAATQERAAEVLGLPFSTYRRHLMSGVERLAARLWNQERLSVDDA
jgi:hypothetical protein